METADVKRLYQKYFDTVYRICFLYMKQDSDACDMLQETFLKLLQGSMDSSVDFSSDEKAKAWLIVTASNTCKSALRRVWRKRRVAYLDQMADKQAPPKESELLALVKSLDEKYGLPLYLYYYEGYKTGEIARMLHSKPSTIQTRLAKGRKLLRMELEGEYESKRISNCHG